MNSFEFEFVPFAPHGAFEHGYEESHEPEAWESERSRGRGAARRSAASRRATSRPGLKPPARPGPRPRPGPAVRGVRRRASSVVAAPAPPCVCPVHGTEYVRWVQSALNQVESSNLMVNGVMSTATRNALRKFQGSKGLPVDGIAGPEVEQALRDARGSGNGAAAPADGPVSDQGELYEADDAYEAYEFETLELEAPPSLPTLRRGARGSAVVDLQRRLGSAGFNAGAADGIFGSNTDAAVRGFQRARGLGVDGVVGAMTWGALSNAAPPGSPSTTPSAGGGHWGSGTGAIRYGKGWGGSEGVADAAKAISAAMGIRVTSEKRNLADTQRVGSSTASDHYTGNANAFATDFGVSGSSGDQLARAIAERYGIPFSVIGTYTRHTITVGDRRYSLQLLWKVKGHFDHVHLGIRRA